jgi:hypothetical protein
MVSGTPIAGRYRMSRKSGIRFSEKIVLNQNARAQTLRSEAICALGQTSLYVARVQCSARLRSIAPFV